MRQRKKKSQHPARHADLFVDIEQRTLDPKLFERWLTKGPQAKPSKQMIPLGDGLYLDFRVWDSVSRPHPITPNMTKTEFDNLRESVSNSGVLTEITLTEQGEVVDGYHRLRAYGECMREGIRLPPLPHRFVRFTSDTAKLTFVADMNVVRRQLGLKQRRIAARQILVTGHQGTDNFVAALSNLDSGETVTAIRTALESTGTIPFLPKRVDHRGHWHDQKRRKAARKVPGEDELGAIRDIEPKSVRLIVADAALDEIGVGLDRICDRLLCDDGILIVVPRIVDVDQLLDQLHRKLALCCYFALSGFDWNAYSLHYHKPLIIFARNVVSGLARLKSSLRKWRGKMEYPTLESAIVDTLSDPADRVVSIAELVTATLPALHGPERDYRVPDPSTQIGVTGTRFADA